MILIMILLEQIRVAVTQEHHGRMTRGVRLMQDTNTQQMGGDDEGS